MKIEGDDVIFDSGKKLDANGGIIGLNQRLEAYGGYDQDLDWGGSDELLTPDERMELAEYMIALWRRYAAEGPTHE